ncbi:heat shock factor-binding protein 1b isoform X1 [Callorhinchus milii]|uniref:heat shock factor-binding protein 1b isoform X1 n=1 Tax=Callorhinchus milii TaxID=7868 RepID=UPI001C3F9F4E|nr:heat shock factor-binding protein 1b isoform X1 [Callorhinchus milii]
MTCVSRVPGWGRADGREEISRGLGAGRAGRVAERRDRDRQTGGKKLQLPECQAAARPLDAATVAMQDKFQTMSDQIIGRIDEMSARIDDLEKNIADLMTQAGVEEIEGENKVVK